MEKNDVSKKLIKGTPKEIRDLVQEIGKLRETAEAKRERVKQLAEDIATKQQQLETLREESRQALADGSDPGRHAKRAGELRDEIEYLQGLMPSSQSVDPGSNERAEREKLERELDQMLRDYVTHSEVREKQEDEFNQAAALMVDLRTGWDEAVTELYRSFGRSPNSLHLMRITDKQVAREIAWHFGRSV